MTDRTPNEQLIREGFDAFNEGRWDDALGMMDPEIEWHLAFLLPDLPPDRTVVRGHEAVRGMWRQFGSAWETLRFQLVRIAYDDGTHAIVEVRVQGTGAGSGIELDRTIYYGQEINAGRLRRAVPRESAEEAATALGLDPDDV